MEEQSSWIPAKTQSSAVDFVIDSFRDALVNKRLAPGDRIPSENELATAMQVSRSTVREAMKVLSAYGIIEIVRGNGTYISKSDENISMDAILFGFLLFVEFGNSAVYLGIKLSTLDLAKDGSIIVFVDGKGLLTVGAN